MIGLVGSGFFNSLKGFRQGPVGIMNKFRGGYQLARLQAPRTAGSFAIFGTLFATSECALLSYRKKEDLLNPILSGFATSAGLSIRSNINRLILDFKFFLCLMNCSFSFFY